MGELGERVGTHHWGTTAGGLREREGGGRGGGGRGEGETQCAPHEDSQGLGGQDISTVSAVRKIDQHHD